MKGSMLLWVMIMALFGAAMVWFGKTLPVGTCGRGRWPSGPDHDRAFSPS